VYQLFLFLAAVTAVYADTDAALALALRARTDFDRVEAQPFPNLPDAARCAQSQAELLPISRPTELPLVRFRKGYCELLDAGLTGNRTTYRQAAQDFAQAMVAWPARTPEPLSAGVQALSAIARLKAGADPTVLPGIRAGLEQALASRVCPASVMSPRLCGELLDAAKIWQGWILLQDGNLAGAAAVFNQSPDSGWASWVAARQAFEAHYYPQAAADFASAVEVWTNQQKYPRPGAVYVLGPRPDLPAALTELGAARYLAGDYRGAAGSLDAAVKARPEDARAWFLRGLAREALGQPQAALEDYQLASRTAFAQPGQPFASGQAHFYRGVWYFRRRAWTQAEDEFASALNFDPGPGLRVDAAAWRSMAAVAAGSCDASAEALERALPQVSGFFPRPVAERFLEGCRAQPRNLSRK